jgi:hypothetical protein
MNNEEMPTGEAQNNQEKVWYKKWWVILIGVIIALPLMGIVIPVGLIWLVWAKAKWSNKAKGWATVGLVILFIFGVASIGSKDENKKEVAKQELPTNQSSVKETGEQATEVKEQSQPETPQAPQFMFDVPSLIGKNIDEVKATLGNPTDFTPPTKQQLAAFDMWDMGYTKDGTSLIIEYSPKSKVVFNFFIDGNDKAKLLALGNLQEKNDAYILDFVKNVSNQNEILGVGIYKKLPMELDANVAYNAVAFQVTNNEDYNWTDCRFEINGGMVSSGYEYKTSTGIKAKDALTIPFSEFTKDGERFNFFTQKPEKLFVSCNTNKQHRSNYFSIK